MTSGRRGPSPRPICVYALVPPSATIAGNGVSGERLRLLVVGRVGAVVGATDRPRPTRTNLLRYDALLRRLWESTSSVVPARFATCLNDQEELAFILRSRQQTLRRALQHVRNRAQMTVRVLGPESDAGLEPGIDPPSGSGRRSASGTEFLRRRAAAAARARRVPGFAPLRAAVSRWLRDERVERQASVATIYHLVPRASGVAYGRAIERAAASSTLRIVVSGPWPAYAFGDGW